VSNPLVEKIANAVLYEGYLLYPYRSSAVKNRQRWNFGVVYPRAYSEGGGSIEPCEMETQCLALGGPLASLEVKVRCLRLVERTAGYLPVPVPEVPANYENAFVPAASIEVDGRTYESWQEAAECELCLPKLHFAELAAAPTRRPFALPATKTVETVRDSSGMVAGLIVRTQKALECWVEASIVSEVEEGSEFAGGSACATIRVRVSNDTAYDGSAGREGVLAQSLLSAHTILRVRGGEFVSLLEPPAQFQAAASACRNVGTWPVLAGEEGQRDTMLSSPIILYDYPQIAPESPGDLFDGAEIDEILSLRILTLTDDEKSAMRRCDDRARSILERTEALPPEHFMKLHGALRALHPSDQEAS
jgi:hydrogenase maturation protease